MHGEAAGTLPNYVFLKRTMVCPRLAFAHYIIRGLPVVLQPCTYAGHPDFKHEPLDSRCVGVMAKSSKLKPQSSKTTPSAETKKVKTITDLKQDRELWYKIRVLIYDVSDLQIDALHSP